MHRIRGRLQRALLIVVSLALLVTGVQAHAQSGSHVVVVKLVPKPNAQFAFEPAAIVAQRGDTVRFVQASAAPHNVHFVKTPKGAKLGDAAAGPYLIGDGKTYDLAIDSRFVDGSYQFTCDPHESVGMHGTLRIGPPAK
jgi:plastocyanin